ncbi:MAG TPA: pyridoxal-phosphate dependent enzyme [Vicinamibacterales bacterium]|nr:pyridoxal-phosphate dependent enzyme [Vicinamibacterales bacterium]
MPIVTRHGIAPREGTSVASLVGGTPLVRLTDFEPHAGVEIYAKLEAQNPGGSVKDRAALAMMFDGERRGLLGPDRVLLDATSGNTGIAYAMLAASRGYRVRLCVPANVTRERIGLLRTYGADLVLTDPMEGSDGAIREARRIYAGDPGAYFYPDQYNNPANWRAHYQTTAPEIIDQTEGRLTHFVAGLGTSGTFVGIGRRLREWRESVRLISMQPDSPLHGLEGLKHMATAIVPGIYDPSLADEDLRVATEDALALTRRLARESGLLVGPSSGAALAASLDVARRIPEGVIVTIFPDGGDRYLTDAFWTGPSLDLAEDIQAAIRRHAVATYPDECCGALLGSPGGAVREALALDNHSDGERRRRFVVTPRDYQQAEARADALGVELVGFYHSHPDHPAVPSEFDLDHAWPNLSYVIVSVRAGRDQDLRSWRLRPDRSRFDEEAVTQRSPSWP